MIERHLDYLQFTANMQEFEFRREDYQVTAGMPYYPHGYRDNSGMRFNFGRNKGANCFVVASGECLQYHREGGVFDAEILNWVKSIGGKVSRLDLAVTEWIEDSLFTIETVEFWWHKKLIDSALVAGGCKEIVELGENWTQETQTVYIGDQQKRAKRGIFRGYDRGDALGIGSGLATRIELELKREKAQKAADRIEQSGDIAGNFRTYFNVKHVEFERIMDSDAVLAVRGKGKKKSTYEDEQMKRWDWLIKQVAPALREAIKIDRDRLGREDRLEDFLLASGLLEEMRREVVANAGKLHDNYLESIGIHAGKFSNEELD